MLKQIIRLFIVCGILRCGLIDDGMATEISPYPIAYTMREVEKITLDVLNKHKAKDVLFVFDIDQTLIMSVEPATHGQNRHKHNMRAYVKSLSKETFIIMLNLSHFKEATKLVDIDAPDVIKNLQQKGIRTVACTASATGSFGALTERMEVFRSQTLKDHGIDFSGTFPEVKDQTFLNIKGALGRSPAFFEGVLCSCGFAQDPMKGIAIVELLKAVHYTPKILVFVDDKELYLKDVEKALQQHLPNVQFIGIQFKGTMERKTQEISQEDFWAFWKSLENEANAFLKDSSKDYDA